ncbi:MAG: ferritin-like domain-containing protein [Bacteroidetes bacterium]|nr:ferritin-like domain-containing protein [Bacteroidota bacterium]
MKGNKKLITVLNSLLADDAIKLAREVDDQGTVDILTWILKMEEGHVDWAEAQRAQIEQMGMENYLATQTVCPVK